MSITPGEVVVGGAVLALAQNERLRERAEANDQEHFVEACHGPEWDALVVGALLAIREATS